jgi:hypothetical protein
MAGGLKTSSVDALKPETDFVGGTAFGVVKGYCKD